MPHLFPLVILGITVDSLRLELARGIKNRSSVRVIEVAFPLYFYVYSHYMAIFGCYYGFEIIL